ncbi:serine protease [Amycolatopsis dendrobii]|uniref:Serine protease n=1 Tax=Amycolatopsis dendrobii TaxID=2760662 RepID=A0A7W3W1E8_9PSEU|nr:serine protease [Amycolatopsis dendrobii]MBB1156985.1 serine protease [Amycolatopsis dendrobii]
MKTPRPLARASAVTALATAAALLPATAWAATPSWAPVDTAAVHPGVQTHTNGAQCTSNFVYSNGTDVFLGQAAHCSGTGGSTETNGCSAGSLPIGTPVEITGASKPGTLVYNSWLTMQSRHEADANTCQYNDLALVKVDPADVSKVNPSLPFWGGPTGVNTTGTKQLGTVLSYGNSELRGGITQLSPKQGTSLGDTGGGWSHTVLTVTPGIPGDSGSGFLDRDGNALGVLSTLNLLPQPGTNGVGDLSRELAYANAHGGLGTVQLVPGTAKFRGPLI